MSGRGKGGKAKGKGASGQATSTSAKAGLQFPVSRVFKQIKKGVNARRVGLGAGVYLTAVLEYLTAEILELAGNAARDNKRTRITPRHIALAIRQDDELNKLIEGSVAGGGVIPYIHSVLVPKGKKKPEADSSESS
jgi:histone H2A